MPYIPPHLRISQDDTPKPTPAAPPSSSRRSRSSNFIPHVSIVTSPDYMGRFIVLLHHPNLIFAPFDGRETFAHLQQLKLHILTSGADGDAHPSHETSTDINKMIAGLSLHESNVPAISLFRAFQKDIKELLEKFKEFTSVGSSKRPLMWLRFGKLLFHTRSALFDWRRIYTREEVETKLEKRCLLRTFDNGLTMEEFTLLHELAHKNHLQSWSKERFVIQVADRMRANTHLWCVCMYPKPKEQSVDSRENRPPSQNKDPDELVLELKKVRLSPVRHMICDAACVGKRKDIRLIFYIKEHLTELTEEELYDLKSSFSNVCADSTSKGGLHWPVGSMQSNSGRFQVVGSLHEVQTLVIAGGLKWCLKRCNRVEFKVPSGRTSFEVDVRPDIYRDFCKGGEKQNLEELMLSIEDLLQRMWMDVL